MLNAKTIVEKLDAEHIRFFTGVPDSLLKDFCAYVAEHAGSHVIAANEGSAVAIAAGHYLASGNAAAVYLQNSGFGNAVNPLLSLAAAEVYGVPMMLIIGWRGEPGKKDEPQHKLQGPLTIPLLETMRIPYAILPEDEAGAMETIARLSAQMREKSAAVALVVREGSFEKHVLAPREDDHEMTREAALALVVESLPNNAVVVSTTGKLSRELFELREKRGEGHEKDFLTVGSMGHASSVALGIAIEKPGREVYCLDGDGAAIMHLGSWAVVGERAPQNFRHIVFNNAAHDSVGGQPTAGATFDFAAVARAAGYKSAVRVATESELKDALASFREGPAFIEIRIRLGSRSDLGRPTRTPHENKGDFMQYLST